MLVAGGIDFLLCPNDRIPLPDGCADEILTNDCPIEGRVAVRSPVRRSEIRRLLKPGGRWLDNGKPAVP